MQHMESKQTSEQPFATLLSQFTNLVKTNTQHEQANKQLFKLPPANFVASFPSQVGKTVFEIPEAITGSYSIERTDGTCLKGELIAGKPFLLTLPECAPGCKDLATSIKIETMELPPETKAQETKSQETSRTSLPVPVVTVLTSSNHPDQVIQSISKTSSPKKRKRKVNAQVTRTLKRKPSGRPKNSSSDIDNDSGSDHPSDSETDSDTDSDSQSSPVRAEAKRSKTKVTNKKVKSDGKRNAFFTRVRRYAKSLAKPKKKNQDYFGIMQHLATIYEGHALPEYRSYLHLQLEDVGSQKNLASRLTTLTGKQVKRKDLEEAIKWYLDKNLKKQFMNSPSNDESEESDRSSDADESAADSGSDHGV